MSDQQSPQSQVLAVSCPYCDNADQSKFEFGQDEDGERGFIICWGCQSCGPAVENPWLEDGFEGVDDPRIDVEWERLAREAMNRRPTPAPTGEAELRKELEATYHRTYVLRNALIKVAARMPDNAENAEAREHFNYVMGLESLPPKAALTLEAKLGAQDASEEKEKT